MESQKIIKFLEQSDNDDELKSQKKKKVYHK